MLKYSSFATFICFGITDKFAAEFTLSGSPAVRLQPIFFLGGLVFV